MAWPFLIAASTALLLGAAGSARGDFIGDLREAVELSEKQQAVEDAAGKPEPAGAEPVSEGEAGGGNGAGATGAATRADAGKSGGSRGRGAGSSRN
ncbi:MAG TPA: hypothetical protein VMM55_06685 [Thermohalobaculum sp.]|nr:hypothetical protein [Thermohalobaculum sp.]